MRLKQTAQQVQSVYRFNMHRRFTKAASMTLVNMTTPDQAPYTSGIRGYHCSARRRNGGLAFASGMAAISTAFLLLSKGDHVLVTRDVYGGTFRMITQVLSRFGIEHTFVDMTNLNEVKQGIQSNTKVIYMETPSNPTLGITDIEGVVQIAKEHDCLTFLDNTF